jgi:hypothetical protein
MLQKSFLFSILVLLFSCSGPSHAKFIPKADTINAVFRPTDSAAPVFFVAKDSPIQTFVPASPGSTTGIYNDDTLWFAKQKDDTIVSHHTFHFISIPKKSVIATFRGKLQY